MTLGKLLGGISTLVMIFGIAYSVLYNCTIAIIGIIGMIFSLIIMTDEENARW